LRSLAALTPLVLLSAVIGCSQGSTGARGALGPQTTRASGGAVEMTEPRAGHTATLLKDGRVLICGGVGENPRRLETAEMYEPGIGFRRISARTRWREGGEGLLLRDGRVLLLGGGWVGGTLRFDPGGLNGDIFDPVSETFTKTSARYASVTRSADDWFRAAVLADGEVFVVGNFGELGAARAALYDEPSDTLKPIGVQLRGEAYGFVLPLDDGRVLLLGGSEDASKFEPPPGLQGGPFMFAGTAREFDIAEIFDTKTGLLSDVDAINPHVRSLYAAKLPDGRVLLVWPGSARAYDPRSGRFSEFPSPDHPDKLPPYGRPVMLRTGALLILDRTRSALWDLVTGEVKAAGSMITPRYGYPATLLADGRVLITGGWSSFLSSPLASAEIYDPATNRFADH
jgi:large repetitive protein